MTEMCFVHCADNFFTRQLSTEESNCLDRCVLKFSNVNQRVMSAYVHDQAIINERRMKEMEEQAKANEAALAASAAAAAVPASSTLETDHNTNINSFIVESELNAKAPILNLAEDRHQSQSQSQNQINTLAS